jgi:hypothetical protein
VALVPSTSVGGGSGAVGSTSLIYRYTVAGASKASIDTGVDVADAGSLDWTSGDVLEVFLTGSTAAAAVADSVVVTVNNDGSAVYDRQYVQGQNATSSAGTSAGDVSWTLAFRGSGGAAASGALSIRMPGYAGLVLRKAGDCVITEPDSTAASQLVIGYSLSWRSTAAISRIKFVGGGGNLIIGTTLAIYKRIAA